MMRGIERRILFHDDCDRRELLERLDAVLPESGTGCFAWVLMPNHVHLVVRTGPIPLSRVMARVETGYAMYFNRRHDRVGHLFQNRYKAIRVTDEVQLLTTIRYVHRNPLASGLVETPRDLEFYPWSGHAALFGRHRRPFHDLGPLREQFGESGVDRTRAIRLWMAESAEERGAEAAARETQARFEPASRPLAAARPQLYADFDSLRAWVCARHQLGEAELDSRSRTRAISGARTEIVVRACRDLGMSLSEVADALGITPAAASQARSRGRIGRRHPGETS